MRGDGDVQEAPRFRAHAARALGTERQTAAGPRGGRVTPGRLSASLSLCHFLCRVGQGPPTATGESAADVNCLSQNLEQRRCSRAICRVELNETKNLLYFNIGHCRSKDSDSAKMQYRNLKTGSLEIMPHIAF